MRNIQLIRLGPRQSIAPMSNILIFSKVGRENSDENAAKTAKIFVVNADHSMYFLVETHDNEFVGVGNFKSKLLVKTG